MKSNDRKWEVLCKGADKKLKRLIDPRICSLHFKETDIASLVVKIFLEAAIRLSLTIQKRRIRPASARPKRFDNQKRRCAEQPKAVKDKALTIFRTNSSEKEFKTGISYLEQNLPTEDIQKF